MNYILLQLEDNICSTVKTKKIPYYNPDLTNFLDINSDDGAGSDWADMNCILFQLVKNIYFTVKTKKPCHNPDFEFIFGTNFDGAGSDWADMNC
jgi:hypothetical protein